MTDPGTAPKPPATPPRPWTAALTEWQAGPGAVAAVVWSLGLLLTILCSATFPEGLLRDPLLPSWVKVTLTGTEAVSLGILVAVSFAVSAGLRRWAGSVRSAAARVGIEGLRLFAAATGMLLLAGSWAVFWAVGRFVDAAGAGFLTANFGQLWGFARQWNPWLLAVVPLLAVASGVAAARKLPRFVAGWPVRGRGATVRIAGTFIVLSVALSIAGEIAQRFAVSSVDEAITGVSYPIGNIYRVRRDQRAGPVTCLLRSLLPEGSSPEVPGPPASDRVRVERPLIQSPEEYRSTVDSSRRRPWNVVIVVVDSVRADCVGAYGHRPSITPTLDALAAQSVIYTDCYTPASHTSLAALCPLTGQYPLRGVGFWQYPERPTYPRTLIYDVLHGLGYRTGLFSSQNEHWSHMSRHLVVPGLDRFSHAPTAEGLVDPGPVNAADDVGISTNLVDDRVTIDRAAAWIGEAPGPFCLSINLQAPHFPYALPASAQKNPGRKPPAMSFINLPRERLAEIREMYEDCVSYADAQIGRLIDRIKALGEWDRTVFVVTADHGQAWYEHGFPTHGSRLYDEVMKVPLIVRAPGREARADGRPAILIDIPPTVFELLGLPPHGGFQGESLLEPSPRSDRSRYLLCVTTLSRQVAIVRDGFKLIRDQEYGLDILYHLKSDPAERRDVRSEYPSVARELGWRLDSWVQEQLAYYGDRERHSREFPPRFR